METPVPIMTVARSAGFASLRRFNDAFKKRFERAPSQLRKAWSRTKTADGIELNLAFRPPFDWQSLIRFYRSHPIPGVERVVENAFERVFRIDGKVGFLRAQPVAGRAALKLTVVTEDPRVLFEVVNRVRRMFDLDSDPMLIADSFAHVPLLAKLAGRYPGLRVPGSWDPFETAVCSILGQVVSAQQRASLVDQLVHGYGEEIIHPVTEEKACLFPGAAALANADLSEVRTSRARKEAVRDFSRRVLSGAISLSEAQDPLLFRKALLQTKGLGSWSAEYISLRSIGDTDAFPRTDLILKRVLALHSTLDLEAVKPWRAYAAVYLWKEFAQTLSEQTGKKRQDSILPTNRDGRRGQMGRKRRSPAEYFMVLGPRRPNKEDLR
ncbi:MAG: DNA-3-methyladenine glycosylase 2 [Chloroflexota bacterium]